MRMTVHDGHGRGRPLGAGNEAPQVRFDALVGFAISIRRAWRYPDRACPGWSPRRHWRRSPLPEGGRWRSGPPAPSRPQRRGALRFRRADRQLDRSNPQPVSSQIDLVPQDFISASSAGRMALKGD